MKDPLLSHKLLGSDPYSRKESLNSFVRWRMSEGQFSSFYGNNVSAPIRISNLKRVGIFSSKNWSIEDKSKRLLFDINWSSDENECKSGWRPSRRGMLYFTCFFDVTDPTLLFRIAFWNWEGDQEERETRKIREVAANKINREKAEGELKNEEISKKMGINFFFFLASLIFVCEVATQNLEV